MSKKRMSLSEIVSLSKEIADQKTEEKFGPAPAKEPKNTETAPKTRLPHLAMWLTVLLITVCAITALFGVAGISAGNPIGAALLLASSAVFGWLTYKSIGWTERV